MKLHRVIDPGVAATIQELVDWGAKCKDISALLSGGSAQEADVISFARLCYQRLGQRPPNGVTASPANARVSVRRHYTLMAADYTNLMKRGCDDLGAILAAYRLYTQRVRAPSVEDRCDPGTWFMLVKGLKKRQYKLVRCECCRANALASLDLTRLRDDSCIWCGVALRPAAIPLVHASLSVRAPG